MILTFSLHRGAPAGSTNVKKRMMAALLRPNSQYPPGRLHCRTCEVSSVSIVSIMLNNCLSFWILANLISSLTAKPTIARTFAENNHSKKNLLDRILETLGRKPRDCVKLVTDGNDDGSYLETATPIQRANMKSRGNNLDLCTHHILDVKDKEAIVSYSRFLTRNSIRDGYRFVKYNVSTILPA